MPIEMQQHQMHRWGPNLVSYKEGHLPRAASGTKRFPGWTALTEMVALELQAEILHLNFLSPCRPAVGPVAEQSQMLKECLAAS
mmetsp:Transcript_54878/g.105921  ORF Transcript_54878/g.105921 Transcript_54878/m.105921 type:complete len:84 (+) Transcript_54878:75-326(+)